ncbi:MAG: pyridoxamine 5'-phosphate oxidase family protein [Ginsengibacter sp.]
MLGTLNDAQIERLLTQCQTGRIGCHAFGKTYVVPVSYAYKNDCVYVHSYDGLKLSMMRQNPEICFQVELMEDFGNWQSVIAWGTFKELKNKDERNEGLRILTARTFSGVTSETVKLGQLWPFAPVDTTNIEGIVFRILLSEKSGRYETAPSQTK